MPSGDSYWRRVAAPVIAAVLAENKGKPDKEIAVALRDRYPFGMRKYHPYKIWCDEIQRQRGIKPPLGTVQHGQGRPTESNPDPRQMRLV